MVSRRGFFKSLLAVLGLVGLPIRSAWAKKQAIPLEKAPKLKKVGGWTVLKVDGDSILFVRDAGESVRAMSSVCTHRQCQVSYNPGSKRVECGCHGSVYDLTGKVLKGPALKPLKSYTAKLSGGSVIVALD
jgi:cytochrome b6-f complex iron-sulfur subunit